MSRGQCAIICAFLGAIAVGVFIVAFESNVALGGGHDIRQNARGIFILVGAAAGLVLGALFGGPSRPGEPNRLGEVKINKPL
jgi:hypothetical protein